MQIVEDVCFEIKSQGTIRRGTGRCRLPDAAEKPIKGKYMDVCSDFS